MSEMGTRPLPPTCPSCSAGIEDESRWTDDEPWSIYYKCGLTLQAYANNEVEAEEFCNGHHADDETDEEWARADERAFDLVWGFIREQAVSGKRWPLPKRVESDG
jgi:hypothetical protein